MVFQWMSVWWGWSCMYCIYRLHANRLDKTPFPFASFLKSSAFSTYVINHYPIIWYLYNVLSLSSLLCFLQVSGGIYRRANCNSIVGKIQDLNPCWWNNSGTLSLSLWLWWIVEVGQAGGLHGVIRCSYLILGVLTVLCNTGWFLLSCFYLINSF